MVKRKKLKRKVKKRPKKRVNTGFVITTIIIFVLSIFAYAVIMGPMAQPPRGKEGVEKPSWIEFGDTVEIDYIGTLENGEVFDTSYENVAKNESIIKTPDFVPRSFYSPLRFTVGRGEVIMGLENAVLGMNISDEKTVVIPPEEGYGAIDPAKIQTSPRVDILPRNSTISYIDFIDAYGRPPEKGEVLKIPGLSWNVTILDVTQENVTFQYNFKKNMTIRIPGTSWDSVVTDVTDDHVVIRHDFKQNASVNTEYGIGRVIAVNGGNVTIDYNPPLAGKTLIFKIKIVNIIKGGLSIEDEIDLIKRISITEDDPYKGPVNAPVTIVEFSDFQCPSCAMASKTVKQVMKEYGDKVRVIYRDFPIPYHSYAQKAAEAAECADEQGKFWEYHDMLFENQDALDIEDLKRYAIDMGLNKTGFNECLDSGKMASEVRNDVTEGESLKIEAVPTFFINGRRLTGAVSQDEFRRIIDEELEKLSLVTETPPVK